MKYFNYKVLVLLLLIATSACDNELEELNENDNLPTESRPGLVLPSVVFTTAEALTTSAWRFTDQVMQYHTVSDFVNFNIYDFTPGATNGVWDELYLALGNVQLMEEGSREEGLEAYLGASLVLRAYVGATLTELWIDAPFSEAGLGLEGNVQSTYDDQQSIYTEVLSLLDQANTIFAASPTFVQDGDVLYNGDVVKWQKLANSLRLRYLLRLSNVSSINADTEIATIISDPTNFPIFEDASDNAVYDYTGVSPSIPGILNLTSLADLTVFNEAYVDYLQSVGDPRLDFFARKPTNDPDGPHVGIESGIIDPSNQRDDVSASRLDLFFDNPGLKDFTFMSFSEVAFIRAEAALNGWTSDDAQSYYETGVTANMSFWGLTLPAGYFTQAEAEWNGTLERLMTQKWVSFYNTASIESWGEFKRTGFPTLVPGPANVTSDVVPTRFLYPLSEQSLNSANYNQAASRIGGDNNTAQHFYQ
ncbi:MAG: SusD/RagB family nutrient-binding outer membrane lipoprotein [Bacteroidota bacterium]